MPVSELKWESALLSEDADMGRREYVLIVSRDGRVLEKREIVWKEFEQSPDYIVFGVEQALRWMCGRLGLES